jgi:NDP-sugar pyrophosphorylase family protein
LVPDAIVLAAGRGNRLRPLTDSLPKVLVPISGKPLLAFHLEALRSAGVLRVVLVVGYRATQVQQFVGDGARFGLDADYVTQVEPLGTGDAVRVARDKIHSDSMLVCYGDVFLPQEADLFRRFLRDSRPKMAGAQVLAGGRFGRLTTLTREGRTVLVGLQEKDGRPTPALVNAGLYLLPRRVLDIVDRLPLSPRGEIELTDAVLYLATHESEVEIVEVGPWTDIADKEDVAQAEALARATSSTDDSSAAGGTS